MPAITPWKKGNDVFYPETGWVSFPDFLKKGSRHTFEQEIAKFAPLAVGAVLVARGRRGRR